MPRGEMAKMPPLPAHPPRHTSRRIGIHTSTSGGVETAAERAYRLGCNAFQVFSSSPRQWKPYNLASPQCDTMRALRKKYDLKPLVIHTSYLLNLAGDGFWEQSIQAFRGEVDRALALCAEYLVLHPGSFRGASRLEGLNRVAEGIARAADGRDLESGNLAVLIENTAGAEFSLGGSFDQVAELLQMLRGVVPVAACLDTCHIHVAGYDIVDQRGFLNTLAQIDDTIGLTNVKVWHCNDAKAACGSKLDRHQHIGHGSIGLEPFRRLLNEPRLAHAAFIAETPIDAPGDDLRNVQTLKSLVAESAAPRKRATTGTATQKRVRSIR